MAHRDQFENKAAEANAIKFFQLVDNSSESEKLFLDAMAIKYKKDVEKLLEYTTHPIEKHLKEAEKMVKQNPILMLLKIPFTEHLCGQREWKAISPIQYTAFSGDTPFRRMMLGHLSHMSNAWKMQAGHQLNDVRVNGTVENGKLLKPLYDLYESYQEYIKTYDDNLQKDRDHFVVEKIGKKQLNSFVHFIQLFCSSMSFSPLPKLDREPERTCCLTNRDNHVFLSPDSPLGSTVALCKVGAEIFETTRMTKEAALHNAMAIFHICKVSTEDLEYDISQLAPDLVKIDSKQIEKHSECRMM